MRQETNNFIAQSASPRLAFTLRDNKRRRSSPSARRIRRPDSGVAITIYCTTTLRRGLRDTQTRQATARTQAPKLRSHTASVQGDDSILPGGAARDKTGLSLPIALHPWCPCAVRPDDQSQTALRARLKQMGTRPWGTLHPPEMALAASTCRRKVQQAHVRGNNCTPLSPQTRPAALLCALLWKSRYWTMDDGRWPDAD